ncbi:GUN4 domain-containing protein [Synechococcus sp. PROS-U-1]|uniref:GUN4 domain-containing protein n=1 Tax=Synechococcus sp. PROS-U-1 TaxID=1400866 RepID=UPI0016485158|nr:GUN4 domain-containing protein [Synechococcus sp. PROS-U-1]QNJ03013.1 ferredoxin-interacting protein Ycf53 [Synechococcus sp. PROS-U-1]
MLSGSTPATKLSVDQLLDRFAKGTPRQRRPLIKQIAARAEELASFGPDLLSGFDPAGDDWAAGWILQVLQQHQPQALAGLITSSDEGWLKVESAVGLNYGPLQQELLNQNFEEADRITSQCLRDLAGDAAVKRGYVYFTEVAAMPGIDLVSLDRLWTVFSQGRFGFTAQSQLLSALDGRYERLWPRIGWKCDGVWTRYPGSFTWSIEAPEGHMPLINQLRGVRLMDSVLKHPALVARRS